MSPRTPCPVICGPTAGGKSGLAVDVCLELAARGAAGEVVSMDAFQVYRGMDIGTAKPTEEERRGVPHHLIDIVEPTEPFSVHEWLVRARTIIDNLRARDVLPVFAGGTHLYAMAILDGLFEGPPPDLALRAELEAMEAGERRRLLEQVDPEAAERIHPNDTRRTVRALEVHRLTGVPISARQTQWQGGADAHAGVPDAVPVLLDWPAETIARRINARVKEMMRRGLLEETRALWEAGRLGPQAKEALGYQQLIEHLEGRASLEEAIERIRIETRRFAKNQRTWLRRLARRTGARRIRGEDAGSRQAIQALVSQLLTKTC